MIKMKYFFVFLITLILISFGCQQTNQLFSPENSDKKMVTLNIGATYNGKSLSSRTVMPGDPTANIADYVVSGCKTGGTLATLTTVATLAGASITIESSTWDFKLEARDSSQNVLVAGELTSVTVDNTSLVLNFTLIPLSSGKGAVNVEITLPTGHEVSFYDVKFGNDESVDLTPSSDKITFTKNNIDTEEYFLVFKLKDSAKKVTAVIPEMVRIKPNLTSSKSITLALTDFNAKPDALSGLTASLVSSSGVTGSVKLDWTDSITNETGFVITWSDDWATWTDIPLSPGVNTYTFNNAVRGSAYKFKIKAINDFGSSDYTAEQSVIIPSLFTVTFDSDGGTAVASQKVENGNKVTQPTVTIEKTNYTFGGWYKESGCTNVWNFTTDTVLANTTIYAKWNTIAVTGISFNVSSVTIKVGNTYTLSPIFTPTNATNKSVTWSGENANASVLNGIVTALNAGTATITATSVEDNTKSASCTVTVQELAANEYLINYVLDGGVNNTNNPATYLSTGSRVVFYEPTKENKVFDGWFTEAGFTNSITDIPAGSTGDKTIYAKWGDPVKPDQENQPGGEVKVPSVPDARAYWLAPWVNDGNWDVGDNGAFVEGATMTTADETGLTSIAAPVTPGTYYLYYVVRDTKEILSISANYLTVLGDNVPFYFKGEIYAGFLDAVDTEWRKVTAQKTDLITGWQNVGDAKFSNSVRITATNLGTSCRYEPRVSINKMNGDIWAVTHEAQTADNSRLWVELWKYTTTDGWVLKQDVNINNHTAHQAMVMKNDGSAMYLSLSTWVSSSGAWPEYFQKRTGTNFETVETVNNYAPTVVKMGGNYLYMISQTSDFDADDEATHTSQLSTHTGINVRKYDTTQPFQLANMTTLGTDKFNVAGTTKYYAFNPEMYVGTDGTPYIVFVEPTTYEHCRHKSNGTWQENGWNNKLTDPKLTVMKYDGTNWVLVGNNLFSPVVYKTTDNAYVAGTTTLRTGFTASGETDFTTTDAVYTPGICVGGGKVWVVATDSTDKAFICAFDGTNWSTVKTEFAEKVRNSKLVYDNGKLYILYSKADGSGNTTYTYIP